MHDVMFACRDCGPTTSCRRAVRASASTVEFDHAAAVRVRNVHRPVICLTVSGLVPSLRFRMRRVFVILAALITVSGGAYGATFNVNTTADAASDGTCLTAGGECSLRAALQEA